LPSKRRAHPRLIALSLAALSLLGGCGTAALSPKPSAPSPYSLAETSSVDPGSSLKPIAAPGFTLTDQFGRQVSLSAFRGKVVVLAFVDSECTTICPLTTASMTSALQLLGKHAADVALVGINANPQHTSVQAVAQYSAVHGLTNRWLFLTGGLPSLTSVWRSYHISVQILQGAIDHTAALYLIDPSGKERYVFLTSSEFGVVPLEAGVLARRIAALLPGHPAVSRPKSPTGPAFPSPADPITLPSLLPGGSSVRLGRGQAHLLVFFTSWAPGTAQGLADLGSYAQNAQAAGLPPLVAVDVGSVEPSKTVAAAAVEQVSPSFPVVLDASGRVADAYGVADIPWLVAVNAQGHIIWKHDGWLPAQQISTGLAAALKTQ
jgi:protein SCO1/2